MIHIWILIIVGNHYATYGIGLGLTSQEFYKESECLEMIDTLPTVDAGYATDLTGTCHKKTVFLDNDRLYQVCNASDSADYFESSEDWYNQCKYIVK